MLLPVLASTAALAQQVEGGTILRPVVYADLAHDRAGEDLVEVWTRLLGRAAGEGERARWFLAVQGEHQVLVALPDEGDTELSWEVRAGESGFEVDFGRVGLKGGYLVERWGKLDMLPVVDVLNGRDLRLGPLVDPAGLRVPTALLRVRAGQSALRGELSLLPFGAANRVALWGTDWSLLRQGMVEGLLADAATWEGDALTTAFYQDTLAALGQALVELDPTFRRGLEGALASQDRPQPGPASAEAALRVEHEGADMDAALMVASIRSRSAVPEMDPALAALLREERLPGLADQDLMLDALAEPLGAAWPRTWFAGLESSTLLGPVGLRMEGAWQSAVAVPRQWMGAATSPAVGAGAGLDWVKGTWLVLGAEARFQHLLDAPDDPVMVAEQAVQVAASARADGFAQRVSLTISGVYDPSFDEGLVLGRLAWRPRDAVEVVAGLLVLGGASPPADTFADAMTYGGGPLGYWGDNDCAFVSFAWIR